MSKKLTRELLQKLKKELLAAEGSLQKRIEALRAEDPFSDPDRTKDNAAIDTDVREKVGHETIEAQILTLQRKLNAVTLALSKIIKGKYGVCDRCGNPIQLERLKFLPEARYCLDCEKRLVK